MSGLVSILIPAHNAAPWIGETLESALAQTWPATEILVVDDGSTDATLARAREYESRGVRVIAQSGQGAAAARNRAWAESRGDWLQFLDADDLLHPEKISTQMQRAGADGPEFAYVSRWTRFTRSIADADFTPQPLCRDSDPADWLVLKLRDNLMMHPAAWLVSRPLAAKAGAWDPALTLDDDGEFFSRVVLAARGVRHCDAALSYYRSNVAGSLSARRSPAACASAFRSLQLTSARLLAFAPDSPARSAAANAFQQLAYSLYPDAPELARACETRVRELGGSPLRPGGGLGFSLVARIMGWRAARRIQHWRMARRGAHS